MYPKNKRTIFLAESQRTQLMVGPRLHLQRILEGHFEPEYFYSLIGVFNIAVALCYRSRHRDLHLYEETQSFLAKLLLDQRTPDEMESAIIRAAFNKVDLFLRNQQKATLARAVAYVEQHIAGGRAIPLRELAELSD